MSNSSSALFDFSEPDPAARWLARPGRQTAFPLNIRNQTGEGHDIAICVEEPSNWAWAMPQRVSLDPDQSATVNIIFSPSRETTIAAGEHRAAIRLRDLEGVIFAECTHLFDVEERQELAMTVTLRGPLITFGQAEGFVLHCALANRGNVDVTVTPSGDPHPSLSFSKRTVSVPFQGEVSFDIEVRWNASRRTNHPDVVTLRAPYRDGEASASIEWRYIAEALEPFMPIYTTVDEDDELLSLSWMQQPEALPSWEREAAYDEERQQPKFATPPAEPPAAPAPVASEGAVKASVVSGNGAVTGNAAAAPPPIRFEKRREVRYTYGRRLNPWWPIVQKQAGRWRVKPLPILMLFIAIEGFIIGLQQAQHDAFATAAAGRIPRVTKMLRFVPDTAAAIVGFGKHAVLVSFQGVHRLRLGHAPTATATLRPQVSRPVASHKKAAAKKTQPRHVAPRPAARHQTLALAPPTQPPTSSSGPPATISSLTASYVKPNTIVISFAAPGVRDMQLTVSDGAKMLYNRSQPSGGKMRIKVPAHWSHPLQVSLIGSGERGVVLQRHVFVWKPGVR